MPHGPPSSSKPAPPTRKRKWKADHIVKIDFGDDLSDSEDISTLVVGQASRDGRRFQHKNHAVPVPRDPPTLAAPYIPLSAEDFGFNMDTVDEGDEEDKCDASASAQVSLTHLGFLRSKLSATVG